MSRPGATTASGRRGLSPWDIAAGILLVREAAAIVSEIEGGEAMLASGNVLAANDRLHGEISRLLTGKQLLARRGE